MEIKSFNQVEYKNAYGILCHALPAQNQRDGMYPTFCQILENGQTLPHSHFEPEIFFIIKGHGQIHINEETRTISAGDLVHIPSFSTHTLQNTGNTVLEFLSVYSEEQTVPKIPSQSLITAAPPTPNGPLHLGHISGPYLASDILSRYLRARGTSVHTHSGTDDNQNYVSEKALSISNDLNIFRKSRRARIQNGLRNMKIDFKEFIEPVSDAVYQEKIQNFAKRAIQTGIIQQETVSMPHCDACDVTLVDCLADGICPNCQSSSRGGCETCGLVVPAHDLLNLHCGRCGKPAQYLEMDVYTFNLSRYLPLIETELNSKNLPPRLKTMIQLVRNKKDYKVLVAYPTTDQTGIKLAFTNHTLHVWFEMAAHYEQFSLQANPWVHFFGFDNSFYYLLFIPAVLKALNPKAKMPDAVVTNEFLLLDGLKFSTSRGHAIWADEFEGDPEHLRLYLSMVRPSQQTADFSMKNFTTFSNELSLLLNTIFQQVETLRSINPKFPPSQQALSDAQKFIRDMDFFMEPQRLDLRQASRRLLAFMDSVTNGFGAIMDDHFKINALADMLSPFMPSTAEKILIQLKENTKLDSSVTLEAK
jgi:methionyl-tRNA synthetase